MLAMAMKETPTTLIENMRNLGLLVVGAAENVIRFLPPLTVSEHELNEALGITEAALKLHLKPTK
jgi:acetylornithine/N-succinyldiaminopimelate aminotransferase